MRMRAQEDCYRIRKEFVRNSENWKSNNLRSFQNKLEYLLSYKIYVCCSYLSYMWQRGEAFQGRMKHLKLGGHYTSRAIFRWEKGGIFSKWKGHSFVYCKILGACAPSAPRFLRLWCNWCMKAATSTLLPWCFHSCLFASLWVFFFQRVFTNT